MDTFDTDPRLTNLPMSASPISVIIICIAYFTFVKILGPVWMKNRKPHNLRGWLIVYNFGLVIANAWLFYKFGKHGWFGRYSWRCANIDYLETEDSFAMTRVSYAFFLSKFLEMADTVFFILRKKYSQVTFLHVVHHGLVPVAIWFIGRITASGFNTLFGFLNSFVHIWMYLYYGLAAVGPSVHKYLWWKKYLTTLQIVQFCIMTLATISVTVTPGCMVPRKLILANLSIAIFFLVLFVNFYRTAYDNERKKKMASS